MSLFEQARLGLLRSPDTVFERKRYLCRDLRVVVAETAQHVDRVLADGYRTADIMQDGMTKVGTAQMTDVVLKALERS